LPDVPSRTVADGVAMPLLGLGVWQLAEGPETQDAVGWALEAGYRHVDTASLYGNEASVGAALAASEVPREQVFVTTKLHPRRGEPEAELEASLGRLGLDRVDLYLVHWPTGEPERHWAGMERCLTRGLTRAIGVSNYGVEELAGLLARAEVRPAVNQVEFSPFELRRELLEACEREGIAFEAYSPLTRGRRMDHPVIAAVVEKHGRSAAQVLLRWALERNVAVIPKSGNRERIRANAQVFDFGLDEQDMRELDALDETGGTGSA
jgi:diketogulonate reductase-like aldo/keto reductase